MPNKIESPFENELGKSGGDSINSINSFFDPEIFGASSVIISEELKKYFQNAQQGPRVRRWVEPSELLLKVAEKLKKDNQSPSLDESFLLAQVKELAQFILQNNHNLHSPRYMGHQVPPPLPIAGIFDFIGSATNQAPGLYEMGPLSAVAEKSVIAQMAKLIGWENSDYSGVGTSGGSLANLTAILAARNHRYPDIWNQGIAQIQNKKNLRPAIVVGADSHYSVMRSAGILGLGTDQVLKVSLDSKRRMDPVQLKLKLDGAQKQGFDIFCIVATSGSTPIGAFDSLPEIAAIAKAQKVWLHVDGAHGASVLLSAKYRKLTQGIELADSIVWDAHKMMYTPALSTFIFYKNKSSGNGAFQQDAPYLNDPNAARSAEFDTFGGTLECTKRPLALGLWAVWSLYGPGIFEKLIDKTFENTLALYELIKASDDFEALHEPQSNILCFRYLPSQIKNGSPEKVGEYQKVLREKLVKKGEFFITSTKIEGQSCLRVTLINPLTKKGDLQNLLQHLRDLAQT